MIVAEFSYCLGQTWDYVDNNLTADQIRAYRKYWNIAPPTHVIAAGAMGYKAKDEKQDDAKFEQLAAAMGMSIPNG